NDPAMMFLNPAYQANYHDYGWSNIGGGAVTGASSDGYRYQDAGIAFSLNSDWNIGAILSYDPSVANSVTSMLINSLVYQNQRTSQYINPIANAWEVVASTHMGSMILGLGVMYGSSNADSTVTPTTGAAYTSEASSHVWGFRAGVIDDLGNGNAFDASAALRLDKATDNEDPS